MTYQAELDDVRQEVRNSGTAAVRFWPKVAGSGNVALSTDPTFIVYDPYGAQLASGTATRTAVDEVSLVTASFAAPSLLAEDYSVVFSWTDAAGAAHRDTVRFDAVVEPFVPRLSLNDLVEEVGDIGVRVERLAAMKDAARSANQEASVQGVRAWGEIRPLLRKKAEGDGVPYPQAVVNREELEAVIIAKAIARIYRLDNAREDASSWDDRATELLRAMPAVRFSSLQNQAPDTKLSAFGVVAARRTR